MNIVNTMCVILALGFGAVLSAATPISMVEMNDYSICEIVASPKVVIITLGKDDLSCSKEAFHKAYLLLESAEEKPTELLQWLGSDMIERHLSMDKGRILRWHRAENDTKKIRVRKDRLLHIDNGEVPNALIAWAGHCLRSFIHCRSREMKNPFGNIAVYSCYSDVERTVHQLLPFDEVSQNFSHLKRRRHLRKLKKKYRTRIRQWLVKAAKVIYPFSQLKHKGKPEDAVEGLIGEVGDDFYRYR